MANIIVLHSRKGGIGKTTEAYELAYVLDAVLVDFEHDGGGATAAWGYRPLDRVRVPILEALATGRVPHPIKGDRKPRLVPGHPDLYDQMPDAETVADALERWAVEWDTEWVVVDTHPGISPAAHGAMQVANAVVVPAPLKVSEMRALEELVNDMADYPLIISPNMVPATPPARSVKDLARIVEGTSVRVGPPIPQVNAVGQRTKRIAMTAEPRLRKDLRPVAEAITQTAQMIQEYVR